MKVAVSIPDELKQAADRRAAELGTSRSAVFAEALRLYFLSIDEDRITAALDEIHAGSAESDSDDFSLVASTKVLAASEW